MRKTVFPSSTLLLAIFSTVSLSACNAGDTRRSETIDLTPSPAIAATTISSTSAGAGLSPAKPAAVPPVSQIPVPVTVTPPPPAPTVTLPLVMIAPPTPKPAPPPGVITPAPSVPVAPAPPVVPDKPPAFAFLTEVTLESTRAAEQLRVPITFGQVFAPGHVDAAHTISAKLADGSTLPLQVDAKARHADGSLRHAILSATLPRLGAAASQKLYLTLAGPVAAVPASTPAALLDAGFSAGVSIELNGTTYSAAADKLLRSPSYQTWLAGPVVNEWLVSAPLTSAQGAVHPHLAARFAVRAFGTKQARVDVIIENNWAFESAPRNFTYDAKVSVGGKVAYTKASLLHYHHARWRKSFWWGGEPEVHIRHNIAYLLDTRALPNYDRKIVPSATMLAAWKAGWTGAKTEPMGVGMAMKYMPSTGGRDDIGLLPGWAAAYLLSMDPRAKEVTLGTASLAGSWSAHYRDKATDRPVSLSDYPYMTIYGHSPDTQNPATKKQEAFPVCTAAGACVSPNVHDSSHQPSFAYLPYLVTGDHYFLEELQFWGMWNAFSSNPGYRGNIKGWLKSDQVRGQAWSLRTIGEAGYISPDADPLKAEFNRIVNANLDWYNSNYTDDAKANKIGVIINGYALGYADGTGLAPWMDDFFTSAVGHLAELGYQKAKPLLVWKATFPIDRMLAPGTCWINAPSYTLTVRPTQDSAFFESMDQVWRASHGKHLGAFACNSAAMAAALKLKVGEMTGYSGSVIGFPSNMQPALAYAADASPARGMTAWNKFIARSVKPDYSLGPQFAIVPR